MKKGDRVRVVRVPANLRDDDEMQTRVLFEQCVGRIFAIEEIKAVEGLSHSLLQLDVGEIRGKPRFLETIWIEPELVEPVE